MKETSTFMQFLQHLASAITTIFKIDRNRSDRSFRKGNYHYTPQAEPFIFPQPNTMNNSFAKHEYTNIGNNAASNNDAAYALLPVQAVNNDALRKASVVRKYLGIVIFILCSFSSTELLAQVTGPGTAWQFCRRITLSTTVPAADYQVKITLINGQYTNIKTDGSDLRFYDVNNNNCSYWIETFAFNDNSTIWVKVASSGSNLLYMYYGNAAATAVSDGATTFPFFDDFLGTSLAGNWSSSGSTISVSAGQATLTNTTTATNNPAITSPFTPSSSSYLLEVKHRETRYYRNRFYATATAFGGSPLTSGAPPTSMDYGYFSSTASSSTTGAGFYGTFTNVAALTSNTIYLTQWQITEGGANTYNWVTRLYSTGAALTNGTKNGTAAGTFRNISISVTEIGTAGTPTETVLDWVRVRKWNGNAGTPDITLLSITSAVPNVSVTTSHTDVACLGASNGTATANATGGGTPYSYSWNSAPTQLTQIATGLPAATFTVTVTESAIGISGTAAVVVLQTIPPVSSLISQTDPLCFNTNTGQIIVGASSGSGSGYTYSVNNGLSYQASNTFNNLGAGEITESKDSNGCESKFVQ